MTVWPWSFSTPAAAIHVTWHCPTCETAWDRRQGGNTCWNCTGDGTPGPIPTRLTTVPRPY